MTGLLEKHNKIVYVILSLLCAVVAYISRQYYIFIASPILILMAIGVLDGREDEKQHTFYEQLLELFEKRKILKVRSFISLMTLTREYTLLAMTRILRSPTMQDILMSKTYITFQLQVSFSTLLYMKMSLSKTGGIL